MRAEDLVTSGKLDADALARLPTTTKGLLYLATVWAPRIHMLLEKEKCPEALEVLEIARIVSGALAEPSPCCRKRGVPAFLKGGVVFPRVSNPGVSHDFLVSAPPVVLLQDEGADKAVEPNGVVSLREACPGLSVEHVPINVKVTDTQWQGTDAALQFHVGQGLYLHVGEVHTYSITAWRGERQFIGFYYRMI
jgi:hypothetical protein